MKRDWKRGVGRRLGWLASAAIVFVGCGRAGLDLPTDGSGGLGGGGQGSSSKGSTTSTMTTSTSSTSIGSTTGVGGAPSCAVAQDCEDGDPCTSNLCVSGQCQFPPRDDDGDGVVATQCGGTDCNDLNPNVFPGHPEDCFDGSDNDCNGVADCLDPACANVPNCGCLPSPGGENCANGADDDCDGKVDCNDPSCVNTPACGCATSEAGACGDGFDEDCDGQIDCADADCASDRVCGCVGQQEDCSDGQDDDCDLLVDCADPDCQGLFPCACVPPGSPEQCSNGTDDDCDGLVDCADPSCAVSPTCQMCMPENCANGLDDNCDGKIDCADPACNFAPNCVPKPEQCNNHLDDDNDGLVDCDDPDCANNPICQEQQSNCQTAKLIPGSGTYFGDTTGHASHTKGSCGGDAGEAVFVFTLTNPSFVDLTSVGTSFDSVIYVRTGNCGAGKEIGCDDDSGGNLASHVTFNILYPGTYYVFLDGFTVDPQFGANEGPFQLHVTITPNPPEQCHDGIDNDGDGLVDCADPECTNDGSCFHCNNGQPPTAEFGPGRCTDGQDNDCDGKIDCADSDCSASDVYKIECCDGIDQTMNNVTDDFDCRCVSTADCQIDPILGVQQICYTHTVRTCGPPCEDFFGDVCPALVPGSFCNTSTHQCEFPP
jgi:hypothetical protein